MIDFPKSENTVKYMNTAIGNNYFSLTCADSEKLKKSAIKSKVDGRGLSASKKVPFTSVSGDNPNCRINAVSAILREKTDISDSFATMQKNKKITASSINEFETDSSEVLAEQDFFSAGKLT